MKSPYDDIIPHFFYHLKNVFFEGWVYAMPPFDLDSLNYLRPNQLLFSISCETINETLEILRNMDLCECQFYECLSLFEL